MNKSVDENDTEMDQEPVNPNLPIRQYLDKHIMPSLIEALEKMTNDKPEDPIKYIGEYLLKEEDKLQIDAANKWLLTLKLDAKLSLKHYCLIT